MTIYIIKSNDGAENKSVEAWKSEEMAKKREAELNANPEQYCTYNIIPTELMDDDSEPEDEPREREPDMDTRREEADFRARQDGSKY